MQKDFEDLIGQGKQAQGVMEAHQGRGHCVYVKKKEGEGEGCEEDWLLILMCARIKHRRNVCKN